MTVFERLQAKIKTDTGLSVVNLKRRYVGVNMKATGAYCWAGYIEGSKIEVGGSLPASTLLKANKLVTIKGWGFSEFEILPADQPK